MAAYGNQPNNRGASRTIARRCHRVRTQAHAQRHCRPAARRPSAAKGGVMAHPLRWTALIALERPELPSFDDIAAWYADQFPSAPPLVAAGATDNLLTFSIGDLTAAATLVPRPIPAAQLEGPAATAWYWPGA